jgi:hypothetical protein
MFQPRFIKVHSKLKTNRGRKKGRGARSIFLVPDELSLYSFFFELLMKRFTYVFARFCASHAIRRLFHLRGRNRVSLSIGLFMLFFPCPPRRSFRPPSCHRPRQKGPAPQALELANSFVLVFFLIKALFI